MEDNNGASSARKRMQRGFTLANIVIVLVAAYVLLSRSDVPPLINGILLPEGRPLATFSLLDHRSQVFNNSHLQGRWSLVSYGFTTCPDICPTTLSELSVVARRLQERGHNDLNVLFYTVDHRRDTVSQLASYIPYFHPDFIGLTHVDGGDNGHLPFEQGLGIMAQLVPVTDSEGDLSANDYEVSHGVTLFLLNPKGQLQAIFKPRYNDPSHGVVFEPDTVIKDYLAIRNYLSAL